MLIVFVYCSYYQRHEWLAHYHEHVWMASPLPNSACVCRPISLIVFSPFKACSAVNWVQWIRFRPCPRSAWGTNKLSIISSLPAVWSLEFQINTSHLYIAGLCWVWTGPISRCMPCDFNSLSQSQRTPVYPSSWWPSFFRVV